jgi:hypothetical protein
MYANKLFKIGKINLLLFYMLCFFFGSSAQLHLIDLPKPCVVGSLFEDWILESDPQTTTKHN